MSRYAWRLVDTPPNVPCIRSVRTPPNVRGAARNHPYPPLQSNCLLSSCSHLSNPCAKNVQISTNIMQGQRFFEKNRRNVWWNWFFSLPLHPHSENECCEVKEPKDWKFGWVAETSSLLNCRAGNRTGGSNPPPSASWLQKMYRWSIHLMVRIQDSQSWHRGSIPLSTTCVFHGIRLISLYKSGDQ